ncbi:MAG TPA: hypothetical protein ACHBZ9_07605, partial [Arsenophonus nasoniae]|uniref:hypothetical protein n=1 Tax=Arsenophonus nasoniae TaxID=638 RepID=UPI0038790BE6
RYVCMSAAVHVALSAIRSLQDSNVKGQAAIPDCTNAKTLIIGHFAKWPMVSDDSNLSLQSEVKKMQSTSSKNHYDDDFKLKSEEDQTQDYGNEPFIYAASLSLEALIKWLKTELATLSDLKERLFYISGCAEHFEQQIMRLEGFNERLPRSLRQSPMSSLFSSANQYQSQLCSMLFHLRSSGLTPKDFQGLGISEKPLTDGDDS